MDDALLVGRLEGPGHGLGDRELRAGVDSLLQRIDQGASADQLQDQEVPLLAFQIAMDAADVRVVELREEAGLEQEAGTHPGVQAVAADGLQGDLALELFVEADEDGSHAAFGQMALDADVTDARGRLVAGADHG